MPKIQQSQNTPYSTQAMYDLINDITRYPEFLPGCTAAEILSQQQDMLSARLVLQKGPMQFSFTTQNRVIPHEKISMDLVEGPFQHLQGEWGFLPQADGCHVTLELSFEMKGGFFQMVATPLFEKFSDQLLSVFVERAKHIYG